jgi:hypothetical protein
MVKGLLTLNNMSVTITGKYKPEILKPTAIIKAINGGNRITFILISLIEGAAEEYHDATATPNVIPIKKEPAWLIKMAICKPSFPYNISKIGKPKKEILLMPPVIINAAIDLGETFNHFPIVIKKTIARKNIIHAARIGNKNLLSNLSSAIWTSINAGIKKLTNSSFKVL